MAATPGERRPSARPQNVVNEFESVEKGPLDVKGDRTKSEAKALDVVPPARPTDRRKRCAKAEQNGV